MRRVVDDFGAGDETRGQFRPAKLLLPAFPWFMEVPAGSSDSVREEDFRESGMQPGKKDPIYVMPFLSRRETNGERKNDFDIVKEKVKINVYINNKSTKLYNYKN